MPKKGKISIYSAVSLSKTCKRVQALLALELNSPPIHPPPLKQIWPPSGEMLASNKTVTVGKHFTLFFKTTTLQGYLLPAFFSAILPPRVQFTTQKWFLEFPLYPFSISKTRYKAKAASQNSEAFEAIIILGMTFMSHSKKISRIEKHLSHI